MSKLKCPNCKQTKNWETLTQYQVFESADGAADEITHANRIDSIDFEIKCRCGHKLTFSADTNAVAAQSYRERITKLEANYTALRIALTRISLLVETSKKTIIDNAVYECGAIADAALLMTKHEGQ